MVATLTSHPVRTRRRRRWPWVLAALVLVPVLVLLLLDWRLTSSLGRIDGAFGGLTDRPATTDETISVLIVGTSPDIPGGEAVPWAEGEPDVESVMLASIAPDRRHVTVEWLPLRGQVLSGATSDRPSDVVVAAETWTGQHVDHLATLDWAALQQLADDNDTGLEHVAGSTITEERAFLQPVLEHTMHAEMRKEPWMLYRALHTVADGMAVDEEWSWFELHRLVFELRNLRSAQIEYVTAGPPDRQ